MGLCCAGTAVGGATPLCCGSGSEAVDGDRVVGKWDGAVG